MTIDFPKNLGHLPDYESIKAFVYSKLVDNTVDKSQWDEYFLEACRTWPKAAPYLNELALTKHRWGAPWRREHFTAGYKSSSPVEGSFSAFQNALGDAPQSFVGVVQASVRKDKEKMKEEQISIVKQQMEKVHGGMFDEVNDSDKQCAAEFSLHITEKFKDRNNQSLNYDFNQVTVGEEYQQMGATALYEVKRRNYEQSKPRKVWEINGVLYCSCLGDINDGLPCNHIQCVRRGAFCNKQFSNHWRICHSVDVAAAVVMKQHEATEDGEGKEDGEATEEGAIFGELDGEQQEDTKAFGVGIVGGNENDGVGVFVTEYAAVNGSSQQAHMMEKVPAPTKVAKKTNKKLDSNAKYNIVLEEAKALASIVSADKKESFEKALVVLRFLRSNIQSKSAAAIISATADYIGVSQPNMESDDTVLAPLLQRTAGALSTKRKRNCVEQSVTKSKLRSCRWCSNVGHTIINCPSGKIIGCRVTASTWEAEMRSVRSISANDMPQQFDPMVPKDAMGLQITGCRPTGRRSDKGMDNKVYRVQIVLKGCVLKADGPALWLERDTINLWASEGRSSTHYVFVKKN